MLSASMLEYDNGTHKSYNYYLLLRMAWSCGHMTIPEILKIVTKNQDESGNL